MVVQIVLSSQLTERFRRFEAEQNMKGEKLAYHALGEGLSVLERRLAERRREAQERRDRGLSPSP